jgi:acyl dehydratase
VRPGDELPELSQQITREQINAYAQASGDWNPIHRDEDVAKSVGLPGVIAHGMLDFGLMSRAVTDWMGDPGRLRSLSARFSSMVRPGDVVTCRGRVQSLDEEAGTAELALWMENQRGERVLNHGRAVVALN